MDAPSQTQPEVFHDPDSTQQHSPVAPSRSRRRLWIALAIYLAALLGVGGLAFVQGRRASQSEQAGELQQSLKEQFDLGVQDLEAGHYEVARQRFEAIARYDPGFPGIEDLLVETYLNLDVPTTTPTPEATSTPDPSPPSELFAHAQEAYAAGDWTTVINKLLTLRSKDATYRAVEADGLMYLALRNRGMDRISQGLMEEGLYDLSLAEQFGPLDRDALFRRNLAEQYLLANTYIGLNWARAAELFQPLCAQGATIDSCPKYADAAWQYGDLLLAADDPCGAKDYFEGSLLAWPNGTLEPTATKVAKACEKATRPPPPPPATETPTPTVTATPEGGSGDGGGGGGGGGDGG